MEIATYNYCPGIAIFVPGNRKQTARFTVSTIIYANPHCCPDPRMG